MERPNTFTAEGNDALAVRAEANGVDPTPSLMRLERLSAGPSSSGLPKLHSLVIAHREDRLAVGTECRGIDRTLMCEGRSEGLPSGGIP